MSTGVAWLGLMPPHSSHGENTSRLRARRCVRLRWASLGTASRIAPECCAQAHVRPPSSARTRAVVRGACLPASPHILLLLSPPSRVRKSAALRSISTHRPVQVQVRMTHACCPWIGRWARADAKGRGGGEKQGSGLLATRRIQTHTLCRQLCVVSACLCLAQRKIRPAMLAGSGSVPGPGGRACSQRPDRATRAAVSAGASRACRAERAQPQSL